MTMLTYLLHLLFQHSIGISLLLILSSSILLWFWSKKGNLPPSPPKLPIIGNLHQLGPLVHRSLRDLSNKYGTLMMVYFGSKPTLVVSSPETARIIMKTCDTSFANRPSTTAAKLLLYGCTNIAFSPYGDYFKQVKKMVATELLSHKRVESFSFFREEETADLIKSISIASRQGVSVNLTKMFQSLANCITCRCAFGRKPEDEFGKNKFGELPREMLHLLGEFCFSDMFPWLGWMDVLTGLNRKINRVSRKVDTFLEEIIDEHVTQLQRRTTINDKQDFVDVLLNVQKDNKEITRDNIKAVLLDMFIGGTDTSSTTMEWTMAELLKNPSKMKKAQDEVRKIVGKKPKVSEEDTRQMHYLKAVLKETLRLHPPLPFIVPRESITSTDANGYHIPAKTRVFINAWAIQRDPRVWNNAEEYIPERFSNNPIDFVGQDFEYVPFGSGRRGCPGISFGMANIELVIANLLYWFDWELPGDANKDGLDMSERFGLSVCKKLPLYLVPIWMNRGDPEPAPIHVQGEQPHKAPPK